MAHPEPTGGAASRARRPADGCVRLGRAVACAVPVAAVVALSASCQAPAAAATGSADPPWVERLPDAEDRIDEVFARVDDTRSPGCAVGLTGPDGLEMARGYGMASLEYGVPLDERSIFRMASVSKQFTAAVALLLERDGRLDLDEDIREILPAFPDYADRYGEPVTVRRLLHHTSGMRDYLTLMHLADRSYEIYDEADVTEMLARQEELNFGPGKDHLYSNSGYFLVSQLVEEVTGASMAEYAAEELFGPLGMDRTHFHDDRSRLVGDRAIGHRRSRGGFQLNETQLEMVGDGGLYTSVEDLARWERIFLAGGESLPTAEVREVAGELADRMLERGALTDGESIDYAMGLRHGVHRGAPTVGHGGSFVGFRTQVLRFPDHGLSVAVLCNLAQTDPSGMAREVADLLLGAELDSREERDSGDKARGEPESRWEPTEAELDALEGVYRSDELDVRYRLERVGDGLALAEPLALAGKLEPGAEEGRLRGGPGTFRVVSGDGDEVEELRLDAGRARNIRFVREGSAGSP